MYLAWISSKFSGWVAGRAAKVCIVDIAHLMTKYNLGSHRCYLIIHMCSYTCTYTCICAQTGTEPTFKNITSVHGKRSPGGIHTHNTLCCISILTLFFSNFLSDLGHFSQGLLHLPVLHVCEVRTIIVHTQSHVKHRQAVWSLLAVKCT